MIEGAAIREDGYIFIATTKNYHKNDTCIISATTNLETRLQDYNKMNSISSDDVYYIYTIKTKKTKLLLSFILQIVSGLKYNDTSNLYKSNLNHIKTLIDNICTAFNADTSLISDKPIPGYVNSIDLLTNLTRE